MIRLSPFLILVCVALYSLSLSRVPFSMPYHVTAAVLGAVSCPILWRYWRHPSVILFVVIIMLVVLGSSIAVEQILGMRYPVPQLWPRVQFLSLFFFVQLSFVFLFRQRMRIFVSDATSSA